MTPEQKALLDKAERSIEAAQSLTDQGFHDFAISRGYYAMFYIAEALACQYFAFTNLSKYPTFVVATTTLRSPCASAISDACAARMTSPSSASGLAVGLPVCLASAQNSAAFSIVAVVRGKYSKRFFS